PDMHPPSPTLVARAPSACPAPRRGLLRRIVRALLAVLGAVLVAGALGTSPAAAANSLASSAPADKATVSTSPASVEMKFNEALGQQNIIAISCGGTPVTAGTPQVGADLLTLTVPLTSALPKGNCVVGWKVSSQDGTPN